MEKRDYKSTLNMPKTAFPMRGNLGNKEPVMQSEWNNIDLYNKRLEKNKGNQSYVLHDGPPYANGNIHIGHALNKILKDFVVRYQNMKGMYARYVPGWDTHGLPIESALVKNKKVNRHAMEKVDFRIMCADYAYEQVDKQREQFKRLGVLGEWDNPYITLEKEFESSQMKVFADMVDKGLIFKGKKPVLWSPSSETALAEAEIEYHDKVSPSIYVSMPSVDDKGVFGCEFEYIIWTTTPWTIPANLAIAVGDHILYSLIDADGKKYVVATELIKTLTSIFGWNEVSSIKDVKGFELEFATYKHPLYDRVSPVILGHHVSTEGGTGLVHTAPGHGEDDFIIGQNYDLELLCPVNGRGYMTAESGKYEGLFIEECNKVILEDLEACGSLLNMTPYTHSYPHDWRTKKPVIFRVTPQWFASIESLKDQMIDEINKVKWVPAWGQVRMTNMVKDRKAWCISRQRTWGVPIPVFYNEDGTEILDSEVIRHVAAVFNEHGSNAWYTMTAEELLPEGYTNEASPNGNFTKETDILDVWFDSGTSHHGGMKDFGLEYPCDLYLEGSDQYRGWFNSSLSTGVASMDQAPYKTVLTHGFVLDGEGRKMSKSLGNVVDPLKVIKQMGADILRLWVSSVDYKSDVRIDQNMMKQVSESYRKIRNTFRFLLGNLNEFNPNTDLVSYEDLNELDKYMMVKLGKVVNKCLNAYDEFEFDTIYREISNFITKEVSAFYLDFTKDITYIDKADSHARRSIQTVMYHTLFDLMRLLTPILPHTMHDVYKHIEYTNEADVYLENMPTKYDNLDLDLETKFDQFMSIREDVLKALEEARNKKVIGKSFNALLTLYPNKETKEFLESLQINLGQVFIVSQFEMKSEGSGEYKFESLSIDVVEAKGHTCERCWQVVTEELNEGLCSRCDEIVNG